MLRRPRSSWRLKDQARNCDHGVPPGGRANEPTLRSTATLDDTPELLTVACQSTANLDRGPSGPLLSPWELFLRHGELPDD